MSLKAAWRDDPFSVVGSLVFVLVALFTALNIFMNVPEFFLNFGAWILLGGGIALLLGDMLVFKLISSPRGKYPPVGSMLLALMGVMAIVSSMYLFFGYAIPSALRWVAAIILVVIALKTLYDVID